MPPEAAVAPKPAELKPNASDDSAAERVPVKPEISEASPKKKLALPSTVLGVTEDTAGGRVICACMDGGIYEADIATGERRELYRHDNFASGVHWLPDRKWLLSTSYDGQIKWFGTSRGDVFRHVKAHDFWSWQSALSTDQSMIASVTGQYQCGGYRYEPAPEKEPSVKVFDVKTGDLLQSFPHVPPVESVAFSNDGRFLAAGNLMGEVRVWELVSGEMKANWKTPNFTGWGIIKGHYFTGGVFTLAFSPDDSELFLSGMGSTRDPAAGNGKQLWEAFDWRAGEPTMTATNEGGAGQGLMETLQFHPSKRYFVMAGRLFKGTWNTAFYDGESRAEVHNMKVSGRITSSAWSSEGDRLFLAGGTGQPRNKDGKGDFGFVRVYNVA